MELYEVVMKLVGPVQAIGETNEDAQRLKNLQTLAALTYRLLDKISDAARDANRAEASMKAIGRTAQSFLRDVREA